MHASLWERYEGAAFADAPGTGSVDVVTGHDLAESVVALAAQRARQRALTLEISTDVVPHDAVSALPHEAASAQLSSARCLNVRRSRPRISRWVRSSNPSNCR
ncbi:hypothetical protein ACWD1Y_32900 [Streptomyces sp. NPDC002814]